jgi:hypothetical protein
MLSVVEEEEEEEGTDNSGAESSPSLMEMGWLNNR